MCRCTRELVVAQVPFSMTDSVMKVGSAAYEGTTGISVEGLVADNPSFFIDKDDEGQDALFVFKTPDARLAITRFGSTIPVYATVTPAAQAVAARIVFWGSRPKPQGK